jgi:hypothetical protein
MKLIWFVDGREVVGRLSRRPCSQKHYCIYIYIYMYTHTHTHTGRLAHVHCSAFRQDTKFIEEIEHVYTHTRVYTYTHMHTGRLTYVHCSAFRQDTKVIEEIENGATWLMYDTDDRPSVRGQALLNMICVYVCLYVCMDYDDTHTHTHTHIAIAMKNVCTYTFRCT